jgi:hypothetical protein
VKNKHAHIDDAQLQATVLRERSTRAAKKTISYAEVGEDSPSTNSSTEIDVTWRR